MGACTSSSTDGGTHPVPETLPKAAHNLPQPVVFRPSDDDDDSVVTSDTSFSNRDSSHMKDHNTNSEVINEENKGNAGRKFKSAIKRVVVEEHSRKLSQYSHWEAIGEALAKEEDKVIESYSIPQPNLLASQKSVEMKVGNTVTLPTSKSMGDVAILALNVSKSAKVWGAKKAKYVQQFHRFFHVTVAIMFGLKVVVNDDILNNPLEEKDFSHFTKIVFPKKGSKETPPHSLPETFEFKNYCPRVFAQIRQWFGVYGDEYLNSLAADLPYIDFVTNSKSGQFFFYTFDKRFLIKTMPQSESVFLRSFITKYFHHIRENPNTFLIKIFGMHRVKYNGTKYHFIIMQNVFHHNYRIHRKYDVKGSSYNRYATDAEKLQLCPVLKDNDFAHDNLRLGTKAHEVNEQITKDALLLASLGIMDYSLLIGIHQRNRGGEEIPMGWRDRDIPFRPIEQLTKEELSKYNETEVKLRSFRSIKNPTPIPSPITHPTPYVNDITTSIILPPPMTGSTLNRTISTPDGYITSADDSEYYFFGIIDILQEYNTRKQLEHFFKSINVDGSIISAVNPDLYATRFVNFVSKHILN